MKKMTTRGLKVQLITSAHRDKISKLFDEFISTHPNSNIIEVQTTETLDASTMWIFYMDDNFKDESEWTSLFLLPEKYANSEENYKIMRFGNPDNVGIWVYESLVKEIKE